ncbi:MAG: hypothetical protein AAB383_02200 [Patescibacteria group bacterium]
MGSERLKNRLTLPTNIASAPVTHRALNLLYTTINERLARLLKGGPAPVDQKAIQLNCREGTPTESVTELCAHYSGLLSVLGIELTCVQGKDAESSENPKEFSEEAWAKTLERILSTSPILHFEEADDRHVWLYDINLRQGERDLCLPSSEVTLDQFLASPEFKKALSSRHEQFKQTQESNQQAWSIQIEVSGAFGDLVDEASVQSLYGDKAKAVKDIVTEIARKYTLTGPKGINADVLRGMKTGEFEAIPVEDMQGLETKQTIERLLSENKVVLLGSSDIPRILTDSDRYGVALKIGPQWYRWDSVPEAEWTNPEARLCSHDTDVGIYPLKMILAFPKGE